MSLAELMVAGARRGGSLLLDALLPPQCLACRAIVERAGQLCATCWRGMSFIAPPYCACCGLPFEVEAGQDALCGECLATPRAFDRARAVLRYDGSSRGPILAFKHGDRTDAAPAFARWLLPAVGDLLAEADLIVPVPLHRWRLWRRRYNQAALLALRLRRLARKPVAPDLLQRRRATPSQGRLSRAERLRNVTGAFAVPPRRRAAVAGKRILLVDDVMTTGATVEACARALRKAGASHVDVACLARVVRGGGDTI
jgi:ComF family protein